MLKKLLAGLFVVFLLDACMPVEKEVLTEIKMEVKDPVLTQVFSFQDQRLTDSLYQFFRHNNPTYRYAATMAMASIRDKNSIDSLVTMLSDEVDKVRIAAAYAIGQIKEESGGSALIKAFQRDDSLAKNLEFNKTILEAVGKCAAEEYLSALVSISTYTKSDTTLLEGQALGIYRYMLRDITLPEGTEKMIAFVSAKDYPKSVKLIAANYLYRVKNVNLGEFTSKLILAYDQAFDPDLKMFLAFALGKTKDPNALQILLTKLRTETDYRINCNIIRALANFEYAAVQPLVFETLKAKNINLAQSAANYFLSNGFPADATRYWEMAKDTALDWRVQLVLYRAANKHLPYYMEGTKGRINQELRNRFQNSTNVYEKGAALMGLSEFGWNYRYINDEGFKSTNPVIRTATTNALANIAAYPNFDSFFGLGRNRVRRELAGYFIEGIKSGDVSVIAIAAETFRTPALKFKEIIDSTNFMEETLTKLELPKDIETYNELQKTIAYFKGQSEPEAEIPDYNHPIDWDVLESIEEDTRAIIYTSKGVFEIKFLPLSAPGTVANFVHLARSGYYDNKAFHRVVPNFVVQGGCPRGDGFGGKDYTIRTEVPRLYYDEEGMVGMASAGKDTESTQWFVTHSPALHLDGNYTLFGKVTDGMKVVHQLAVGDVVQKITVLNK